MHKPEDHNTPSFQSEKQLFLYLQQHSQQKKRESSTPFTKPYLQQKSIFQTFQESTTKMESYDIGLSDLQ